MKRKRPATAECSASVSLTDPREGAMLMQEATGCSSNPSGAADRSCETESRHEPESPAAHLLLTMYEPDSPETSAAGAAATSGDRSEQHVHRQVHSQHSANVSPEQQPIPAGGTQPQPTNGTDQGGERQPAARRQVLPVTTRGTRGLQSIGLQLLTMREKHDYELRIKAHEIEKQKIENEVRRLALEERRLDLEEKKHELEVRRYDREHEKLLEKVEMMLSEQTKAIFDFLSANRA
ncbi:uncharacterized protein [Dermacentor albipictus]|uniref:uncharacterized protein n=1 Tax=Dermacentor albipictus TaxID=60249 RepID=UPI0031FC3E75